MLHLVEKNSNVLSLDEAMRVFDKNYHNVNAATKIKLKCWLYYCQSRNAGGKGAMPFEQYSRTIRAIDCLEHLRGRLIDCSDIGNDAEVSWVIAHNIH